jgi:F-type H+-transporting ATPase subunit gamma
MVMTERMGALREHIESVRELESVVNAMRAIAAARSREARERIAGIQSCSLVIGEAIADALRLDDRSRGEAATSDPRASNHIIVLLCAEQGFVGTFNEHIVASADAAHKAGKTEYFVMGTRGETVAREHGLAIGWAGSMPIHADEVPVLADRLADALYDQLRAAHASRVSLVHAQPAPGLSPKLVRHALLPFDFARFTRPGSRARRSPPLVSMRAATLLAKLAQEYMFAQLCEAIMLSYAAENEARMRAMSAALDNVHQTARRLSGSFCRLRQEMVTAEIVELSAGARATSSLPEHRNLN